MFKNIFNHKDFNKMSQRQKTSLRIMIKKKSDSFTRITSTRSGETHANDFTHRTR